MELDKVACCVCISFLVVRNKVRNGPEWRLLAVRWYSLIASSWCLNPIEKVARSEDSCYGLLLAAVLEQAVLMSQSPKAKTALTEEPVLLGDDWIGKIGQNAAIDKLLICYSNKDIELNKQEPTWRMIVKGLAVLVRVEAYLNVHRVRDMHLGQGLNRDIWRIRAKQLAQAAS